MWSNCEIFQDQVTHIFPFKRWYLYVERSYFVVSAFHGPRENREGVLCPLERLVSAGDQYHLGIRISPNLSFLSNARWLVDGMLNMAFQLPCRKKQQKYVTALRSQLGLVNTKEEGK